MSKAIYWGLVAGYRQEGRLLEANRVVLDDMIKRDIRCEPGAGCRVEGRVKLRKGTVIDNSTIRGPVS